MDQSDAMHWSGDKTVWDRKRNRVELEGNAFVNQPGESLSADFIVLDLNNRMIDAKGNCVYTALDTIIYSDEMHFSLDTGVGTIIGGRVTNGRFMLVGERINKLGGGRFQTHRAEYTTCHDCSASWSLLGEDVEFEIEGYAYLTNVTGKIKDTPFMWLPYMVVPIKTRRQTGLLFPRFGTSTLHGFMFVQPFFWAINRSADMTLGAGTYTARGKRFEWEGRYALGERSGGTANFYYLSDKNPDAPTYNRWGLQLAQTQELFWGIDQKLRIYEVSDSLYPVLFDDIPGRYEPVLASELSFSRSGPEVSGYLAARRYRNLLDFGNPTGFDERTVQLYPRFEISSNDRFLWGSPIATGLTLGVSNFWREGDAFDRDCEISGTCPQPSLGYQPGIDPIRRGSRYSITPSLYTTLRPFDLFSVVPSVEYRGYFYDFYNELEDLSRGYLLFQTELSMQLERIFDQDDVSIPRVKHLIRPTLLYSRIPYRYEPDHPFIDQVRYRSGYNFDNYDIVPFSTSPSLENYTIPLGHSLSYGLKTQVIRRRGELKSLNPTYQTVAEFTAGQTFNILELERTEDERIPLSRFFSTLNLNFDRTMLGVQYYFYPYLERLLPNADPSQISPHEVSVSGRWIFESTTTHEILPFERSIGLSYYWRALESSKTSSMTGDLVYSINDFILPRVSANYNFLEPDPSRRITSLNAALTFQGPSRCWKFTVNLSDSVDRGTAVSFDLSLNLTGDGFGGVTALAEKTMSSSQ